MSGHERFEHLCALAAVGELPTAEGHAFDHHLETCADCRQVYADYIQLNAGFIAANDDTELIAALEQPTKAAVLQKIVYLDPERSVQPAAQPTGLAFGWDWSRWLRLAGTGSLTAVFALAAFWLGVRFQQFVAAPEQVRLSATTPTPPVPAVVSADREVTQALSAEKQRSSQLEATLGANRRQLTALEAANDELRQKIVEQTRLLSDTQSLLDSKMAELKKAEATQDADSATLVALRYEVNELTDKLNSQTESLKRQTNLLAGGREIRDIIGARNLHIIDVYDADSRGRTKKPFARAFYTEGKSLVFYAYDLPLHEKDNGEYAYVAWGQRGGKSSSIRNLGILINDDKGQKRWMLTFSDPTVLAEIDSVFITLESVRDAVKPSGKRMLTAYLEDLPNHP